MADPSIEAAQRAWDERYRSTPDKSHWIFENSLADDGIAKGFVAAAREMAKTVQELHVPFEVYGAEGRKFCSECSRLAALNIKWPCETAKRVYSSEELATRNYGETK